MTTADRELIVASGGAPPSSVDSRSFVRRNRVGGMRIGGSVAIAEGNEVVAMEPDAAAKGIDIQTRPGADLVVRGNDIQGFNIGIRVLGSNEARETATTRIVENTITDNRVGIRLFKVGDAVIETNTFCDNEINVDVRRGPGLKVRDSCAAIR